MLVVLLARCVEHHEHQIRRASHRDDFAAAAFATRCTFYNAWQVEHLNLRVVYDDVACQVLQTKCSREANCADESGKPGMQVKVVNSYAAVSLFVSVTAFKSDDFPTDGKPINATRPSPLFAVQ